MDMFERIMIPTDGFEFADRFGDYAIEIAIKFNSTVVGVNIIDEKLIYPFEVLETEGKVILKNLRDKAEKKGLKFEEVLIVGNPIHDMEKIVKKTEADLVVIGTHGKTGFQKFILGSVTENALKTVKVPILLVK